MAILAGEIVSAGRLNRMQPVSRTVRATAPLVLSATATETDIPGCEIAYTTETDGATWSVIAVFDCVVTTTNTSTLMEGRLTVDGVLQLGRATHGMDTADRDSVAQFWDGTFATAGVHTLKLRGALTAAVGAGSFQAANTVLGVEIKEVA